MHDVDQPATADQIADLLLPLDGPYPPDKVIEAARTIAELVRRLNHATYHPTALRYPPQLYRTVSALNGGVHGLRQLLGQLAARLEMGPVSVPGFAADPKVLHDDRGNPSDTCIAAAHQLRAAAHALIGATTPLDAAVDKTCHLGYDVSGLDA